MRIISLYGELTFKQTNGREEPRSIGDTKHAPDRGCIIDQLGRIYHLIHDAGKAMTNGWSEEIIEFLISQASQEN